jgi:hypothetical protein
MMSRMEVIERAKLNDRNYIIEKMEIDSKDIYDKFKKYIDKTSKHS